MVEYFGYVLLLLILMAFYQLYSFSTTRKGVEKQRRCLVLGVMYLSFGIVCLVFRNPFSVIGGCILLMLGLRLTAHGLDRVDKRIQVDRYVEDNHPAEKNIE